MNKLPKAGEGSPPCTNIRSARSVITFTLALSGCTLFAPLDELRSDEDLFVVDCATAVPRFSDVTAFHKCTPCHASTLVGTARNNAPAAINFDTYLSAETSGSMAMNQVNEGAMPPPYTGVALSEDEKQTLYKWALCGALE